MYKVEPLTTIKTIKRSLMTLMYILLSSTAYYSCDVLTSEWKKKNIET